MRTSLRLILLACLALGLVPAALDAQTVLASTTLAAALAGTTNDQQLVVASTTGWTASSSTGQSFALVDREVVQVRTVNATTKAVTVTRGMGSTRVTPHITGATIWTGPAAAFVSAIPAGQCTRTALAFVPWIVTGGAGLASEIGTLWDCLGVAPNGQWVQTNDNGIGLALLGSTVVSATSVTPTGTYFKMSGTTNPVSTIVTPAGIAAGFSIQIEPTGTWVTGTGGNILLGSSAVVGKLLTMTWDGAAWVPSY